MIGFLLGSVKEKIKLKAVRGNRNGNKKGQSKDEFKCIRCLAISTDGKFLV